MKSVLSYCLDVCHAGATTKTRKAVQRVINTAPNITGCSLPLLEILFPQDIQGHHRWPLVSRHPCLTRCPLVETSSKSGPTPPDKQFLPLGHSECWQTLPHPYPPTHQPTRVMAWVTLISFYLALYIFLLLVIYSCCLYLYFILAQLAWRTMAIEGFIIILKKLRQDRK